MLFPKSPTPVIRKELLTCGHHQQPSHGPFISVQHPQDAGRKKEALIVWVSRHDEGVFGVDELGREDSCIIPYDIGDEPLKKQGDDRG